VWERLYLTLTALSVRGCSENADVDSEALVREITASTEPRMSKSGPLRTERVGHSLTFVALCWGVWARGPFSSLGMNGLTVMERSVLAMRAKTPISSLRVDVLTVRQRALVNAADLEIGVPGGAMR